MQLINPISNGIGRAIDWTVDSSWGLSYWHSIPSTLWDSRIRQMISSAFVASFPALIAAQTDPENPSPFGITGDVINAAESLDAAALRLMPNLRPTSQTSIRQPLSLSFIFFPLSILSWLWETKFLSAPLDGGLLKTILANSAVATLDIFSIAPLFKRWEKPGRTRSGFAFAWLLYRCADIGLSFGNASHGLVRLDLDPTLSMARRLAFWAPN